MKSNGMIGKLSLISALAVVGLLSSPSPAVNIAWTGGGGTSDWNTGSNWDAGVPGSGDSARIESDVAVWPIITAATVPVPNVDNIRMGSTGGSSFEITGGTLNVGRYIILSSTSTRIATWLINGGTVNTGLTSTNAHLIVGQNGQGTVVMSAGTVNLGADLVIAENAGSSGSVTLNGGVINANRLRMPSAAAGSLVINGGTINLSGDDTTEVTDLLADGKIVTTLPGYSIDVSYDSNSDITIIKAIIPEPTTASMIGLALLGLTRRRRNRQS